MPDDTLFVFATFHEAKAFLIDTEAKELKSKRLYESDLGKVLITGMGSISTASVLARYLDGVSHVVNAGIAGSLSADIPVGSFHCIKTVFKHTLVPEDANDHCRTSAKHLHPPLPCSERGVRLMTVDYPICNQSWKQDLSEIADVVDMEGYAVRAMCSEAEIPCTLYKLVSDVADEKAPSGIRSAIQHLSKCLSQHLVESLG